MINIQFLENNLDTSLKPYGVIYKITNKINGKVYIGQTTDNLEKRFYNHIYYSSKFSYYLSRSIQKNGQDNFKCEEIDKGFSQKELNYLEKYWIKYFNSNNKDIGYNMTEGGEGNVVSDQRRLERCKFLIKCIETDEVFITTVDASRYKNISRGAIHAALINKNRSVDGCRWERVEKNQENINKIIFIAKHIKKTENKTRRKVLQVETGIIYNSVTEARKANNIDNGYLIDVLKNEKSCKGFHYKYLEENKRKICENLSENYNKEKFRKKQRASKKVQCLETKRIWNSIQDLSKEIGGSKTWLGKTIKNGVKYKKKTYIFIT